MNESRRNMLVGLFVIVGLFALGALVLVFQEGSLTVGPDEYTLTIHFDSASGIRAGSIVSIGGITVGRVRAVDFVDASDFLGGVEVLVALDRGYRLRAGTRAETAEPGFGMGRPPIVLLPGPPDAPELVSGEIIQGRMIKMVESLLPPTIVATFERTAAQIGDASAALTPVLRDLHDIMQPRTAESVDRPGGERGNLSSAMQRLDTGLKNMNAVFGDPAVQSQLKTSIENFHTMTVDGAEVMSNLKGATAEIQGLTTDTRTFVADANSALQRMDGNVERIARALMADLELAGAFLTQLNAAATKIGAGEGTIGRIISDERLYEAMVLTFRRLAEATEEFRLLAKQWQEGKVRIGL